MYAIQYSKKASATLLKMPKNYRDLIIKKIALYAANPTQGNQAIKLAGREGYRLRVGDWRVIFEKHDDVLLIFVLAVDARGGIYQ